MQCRRTAMSILPAFSVLRAQPDALLAVDAVVADEHVGVDAPAFGVERVGVGFVQGTGALDSAQHWARLLIGKRGRWASLTGAFVVLSLFFVRQPKVERRL